MHQSMWKGIEDRAMLGIGFVGGLRRAETAALTWADLEGRDDVIAGRVSRLKTNQTGDSLASKPKASQRTASAALMQPSLPC